MESQTFLVINEISAVIKYLKLNIFYSMKVKIHIQVNKF